MAIVTIAVAIAAPQLIPAINGLSPGLAAAASAGLGNLAGQITGNIIGTQSGFDFKSFGTSVLTAGITQGVLGPEGAPTGLGASLRSALGAGSYAEIAARAVVGNVINQGVGNLTGAQKGFSWSSVAIAGIGAGVGAYASDKLGLNGRNPSAGQDLGRAAVNAGANALAQITIRGGKVNWQQVATDTILNFSQSRISSLVAEQRAAQGNANDDPTYSTRPKGSFTQELLSSNQVEAAAINDKPNFNGLRASYINSPEQLNAKNGGLNADYGDALGNGVVYGKEQYMKGMSNANKSATNLVLEGVQQATAPNSANQGDWSFTNDRIAREAQLIANAGKNAYLVSELPRWDDKLNKGRTIPAGTHWNIEGKLEPDALTPFDFKKQQLLDSIVQRAVNPANPMLRTGAFDYAMVDVFYPSNAIDGFLKFLGVGATLKGSLTLPNFIKGSTINTSVNYGFQKAFNPNGEVSKPELFNAFVTGGLTYGQSLPYSMLVNSEGAYMTTWYTKKDTATQVAGALVGTYLGDKTGSFIVNNRFLNNQVNAYTVRSLIQGDIRAASIISSSKQYLSPIGSSIVGEPSNGVVDTISKINYFSK